MPRGKKELAEQITPELREFEVEVGSGKTGRAAQLVGASGQGSGGREQHPEAIQQHRHVWFHRRRDRPDPGLDIRVEVGGMRLVRPNGQGDTVRPVRHP